MSQIPSQFTEWKQRISDELRKLLQTIVSTFDGVHALGGEVSRRLERFAGTGKMIRGGLVCLASALENGTVHDAAYRAAGAVELFQSALLVHDDIMDRDATRRGETSVYMQYVQDADRDGIDDSMHIGESLGMCVGDIAFFIAFELLSSLPVDDETRNAVIALSSKELQYVGIAQMADVYRGAQSIIASGVDAGNETDTTLKVYLYKTGRYTFSLPLMIGAHIAGSSAERISLLERLGEKLGVLFQIKDDEIGLFGSQQEIGKPVGSDVREGKKTIYYTELLRLLDAADLVRLEKVFGNPDADEQDILWVRSMVESSGVAESVDAYIKRYADEAEELLLGIRHVHEPTMELLNQLHRFNMTRTR